MLRPAINAEQPVRRRRFTMKRQTVIQLCQRIKAKIDIEGPGRVTGKRQQGAVMRGCRRRTVEADADSRQHHPAQQPGKIIGQGGLHRQGRGPAGQRLMHIRVGRIFGKRLADLPATGKALMREGRQQMVRRGLVIRRHRIEQLRDKPVLVGTVKAVRCRTLQDAPRHI